MRLTSRCQCVRRFHAVVLIILPPLIFTRLRYELRTDCKSILCNWTHPSQPSQELNIREHPTSLWREIRNYLSEFRLISGYHGIDSMRYRNGREPSPNEYREILPLISDLSEATGKRSVHVRPRSKLAKVAKQCDIGGRSTFVRLPH